jgi:2-polyprenyl-3-methyl-5-hydroxy-6-metoxy-1,4-benzoquinol methylase
VRRVTVPSDRVAIVGAGMSQLVVDLVRDGYQDIEAIDISQAALDGLEAIVGPGTVVCRCVDVRTVEFAQPVSVWHDRAVFHFLTDSADQAAYAARAAAAVCPGGHLLVATFALDGPEQCSGLPVQRHDEASLTAVFGASFELIEASRHTHLTPWGAQQRFIHTTFRRHHQV